MSNRSGHYFIFFILFGFIAAVVSFLESANHLPSAEALWLLISGALGMVLAHQRVNDVARYYDVIVGLIFLLAGLAGLAFNLKALPGAVGSAGLITGSGQDALLLGLSLAVIPSILHLILGGISVRHGMTNSAKKGN